MCGHRVQTYIEEQTHCSERPNTHNDLFPVFTVEQPDRLNTLNDLFLCFTVEQPERLNTLIDLFLCLTVEQPECPQRLVAEKDRRNVDRFLRFPTKHRNCGQKTPGGGNSANSMGKPTGEMETE